MTDSLNAMFRENDDELSKHCEILSIGYNIIPKWIDPWSYIEIAVKIYILKCENGNPTQIEAVGCAEVICKPIKTYKDMYELAYYKKFGNVKFIV